MRLRTHAHVALSLAVFLTLFGSEPALSADLKAEAGDLFPFAPLPTLVRNRFPLTVNTVVTSSSLSGAAFASAAPLTLIAAVETSFDTSASAIARPSVGGVELVVARFDPRARGLVPGPRGEVSVPVAFGGGVVLRTLPERAFGIAIISRVETRLAARSALTPEVFVEGSAQLSTGGDGPRVRSSGLLTQPLPPNQRSPGTVGGNFDTTLQVSIIPNSPDPRDRTISIDARGEAVGELRSGPATALSFVLLRINILGPRGLSFDVRLPAP